MTLMELTEFENYLKKRNLSAHTITAYLGSVKLYYSQEPKLTIGGLRRFRSYLIRHYRPATVNLRIHGINQYIRFLLAYREEDWIFLSGFQLRSVKLQKKSFSDSTISNEDYSLMKQKLKEEHRMLWYFVVRFLGATGARVSELIQIKVEHLRTGYLDLYAKGGKLRRVYFPDSLCQEALAWCEAQGKTSGFFFVNRRGQPITARGIRSQLKTYALRYGIDADTVYPHSFRHRFAINFLAEFNDISLLADLMGHENIETTRIYLTKSGKEQQRILDKMITW